MSDPITTTISPLTGTVSFSRKVQVRQYESAEASIYVQFQINPEDGPEAIVANARDAFAQAKTVVFDELGIEFTVEEGGVIRELIERTLGPTTEVSPAPAPSPAADGDSGATPPYDAFTKDPAEKRANGDWAKARLASHPSEFWDNRTTKTNPKAPDFKHKSSGVGVWS